MTDNEIFWKILKPGYYLREIPGTRLRARYKLYHGNEDPIYKVSQRTYKRLADVLLFQPNGKMTVSRRAVQKLSGKTLLKRIYREILKNKKTTLLERIAIRGQE